MVVVGGGSAGWLTAGLIAADHQIPKVPGLEVTLVESPSVSPIGVGEGTWPSMRDTLRRIGVSETDFIRECDASFKQGSRFADWSEGRGEHYYHPFSCRRATAKRTWSAVVARASGLPVRGRGQLSSRSCASADVRPSR